MHAPHSRASFIACTLTVLLATTHAFAYRVADITIARPDDADVKVKLAADELRRYAWLLTGTLPAAAKDAPAATIILRTGADPHVPTTGLDPSQNYALYKDKDAQVVHGASPVATLWGAYRLIAHWGAGFYLGGDALPPVDTNKEAELLETTASPVLSIRGNLPWFNFLNSPTTWNPQDYKTFFAQLVKQRANLIGFHAYDHEPFGGYDITPKGATMGGPLMTTISPTRWWSPAAMATGDFLFGTDLFFDRSEWGCEIGIDDAWAYNPGRATRLQQQMMAEALAYGQVIGLRTCLGFEATGDSADAKTREAFEKRLRHVLTTYPLDYFWLWQSEGRGTAGHGGNWVAGAPNDPNLAVPDDVKQAFAYLGEKHDFREAARITQYVRLAHEIIRKNSPRVRLIVSGWGGDAWMRFSSLYEGLDKVVPPDVIFAALDNIDPRLQNHVSEAYGKCAPTRERWPIPWFESDGGHTRIDQTGPQTNTTAFEPLLKDIVAKKCQGALGIHWRSRNVEDVAGYLYRFGWNSDLTAANFFAEYARNHYGVADAERIARVHLRLEELGPQYVGAVGAVECSTPFTWFVQSGSADKGREPNRAGHLPDPARFPELEKLAGELRAAGEDASKSNRLHAAQQYHDLAQTITWLVIRAKVGLAIWNDEAPLSKRLTAAETLLAQGKTTEARQAATDVLAELKQLRFDEALTALASTCRTRGELGMLATANSRYGRFYAAFLKRIEQVLGRPLPLERGSRHWTQGPLANVFLVPGEVTVGTSITLDAVILPIEDATKYRLEVTRLEGERAGMNVPVKPIRLGGGYLRATVEPKEPGAYSWAVTDPEGRLVKAGAVIVQPKP